jgi:precorrin-2 methylase
MTAVREGLNVCAAFYGHPGVFVYASHQSIRLARAEGFEAQMLPGISAEDCVFADLGIDPENMGVRVTKQQILALPSSLRSAKYPRALASGYYWPYRLSRQEICF